jgi:hypothetical protein
MKLFAGLVPWVLPLAAFIGFMFGGLWYGVLSKQWLSAANLTEERVKASGGMTPKLLGITFLAELFMAWMLAGIILHMKKAGIAPTAWNGMISAAFIWAGFIMTTLVVNHGYQLNKPRLTLIDGGHWLGVMLLMGAIIGRFGVL